MEIVRFDAEQVLARIDELSGLLEDAVQGGASIGFLPPLAAGEAAEYWRQVVDALRGPARVLLVAIEDGRIAGTVQLAHEMRRNGDHRSEVIKLMVHTSARRRGIGRALMAEAEQAMRDAGRTLMVLDTRCGDPSEALYWELGFAEVGTIPRYARSADGTLHETVIMYKQLA